MGTGEEGLGVQPLSPGELSATALPASRTDWVGRGDGAKVQSQEPMKSMEGDSGEAGERRSIVSRCSTEHSSPSILKVLASTLTPGPLFQLSPEEPHTEALPDSTTPTSHKSSLALSVLTN